MACSKAGLVRALALRKGGRGLRQTRGEQMKSNDGRTRPSLGELLKSSSQRFTGHRRRILARIAASSALFGASMVHLGGAISNRAASVSTQPLVASHPQRLTALQAS